MDETTRALIDKGALELRFKLADGRLFGEPIDINDKNMCILGAYALGQREADEKAGLFVHGVTTKQPTPKPEVPRHFCEGYGMSDAQGPIRRLLFVMVALYVTLSVAIAALFGYVVYALSK